MPIGQSIGGTAQFLVGGVLYSLAGTMKVDPGGVIKTPAVGPSGPTGNWTEKNDPPMIEVEVFDNSGSSVTALRGFTGGAVQVQQSNGKVWLLRNAFVVDKIDVDLVSGKYSIKFSGTDIQEITTA